MYPQYPYPNVQPQPGAPIPNYPVQGHTAYPYPPQPAGMPPVSSGAVPQLPGISDARTGSGGSVPSIRELEGRAVLVMPTRIERGVKGLNPDKTEDRVTMTVWVLDGGPLTYGSNVRPPSPPTHRVDTVPARFDGVLSSHANIVRTVEEAYNSQTHQSTGVKLGRIVQGVTLTPGNNNPWNLRPLDDSQPADAQARAIAAQVHQQVNAGTFVNPTPVDLATPQQAPAQQMPYYGPGAGTGTPAYPPQASPHGGQQLPIDQPPPGVPPAFWATLSPEQKAAFAQPQPPMPAF